MTTAVSEKKAENQSASGWGLAWWSGKRRSTFAISSNRTTSRISAMDPLAPATERTNKIWLT